MIKLKNFSFLIYSVFAHTVHASIFSEFPLFSFKKKKSSEKYKIYIFFFAHVALENLRKYHLVENFLYARISTSIIFQKKFSLNFIKHFHNSYHIAFKAAAREEKQKVS